MAGATVRARCAAIQQDSESISECGFRNSDWVEGLKAARDAPQCGRRRSRRDAVRSQYRRKGSRRRAIESRSRAIGSWERYKGLSGSCKAVSVSRNCISSSRNRSSASCNQGSVSRKLVLSVAGTALRSAGRPLGFARRGLRVAATRDWRGAAAGEPAVQIRNSKRAVTRVKERPGFQIRNSPRDESVRSATGRIRCGELADKFKSSNDRITRRLLPIGASAASGVARKAHKRRCAARRKCIECPVVWEKSDI